MPNHCCHVIPIFFSHRDRAVDAKYLLLNQFTRMNSRIHRIMLQDSWQQTDMSNICTTLARCHFVLAPTAINSNAMKSSATIDASKSLQIRNRRSQMLANSPQTRLDITQTQQIARNCGLSLQTACKREVWGTASGGPYHWGGGGGGLRDRGSGSYIHKLVWAPYILWGMNGAIIPHDLPISGVCVCVCDSLMGWKSQSVLRSREINTIACHVCVCIFHDGWCFRACCCKKWGVPYPLVN